MDNIFHTRSLTTAVNMITPVPTVILDQVFSKKMRQLSPHFAWDVHSNSERVLKSISANEPAFVADAEGYKTITCDAPRFAEKRLISAADLASMRAFGQQSMPEILMERVGREQAEMRRKIDLTREFMAAKALSGQVVDESGEVLVDYNFSANQTPTLTGTDLWTDAASNPLQKIRSWKKQIAQGVGNVTKWVAFAGSDAMDAILENVQVMELIKYTQGGQVAEDGRVANLAGVSIFEYYGSYIDSVGTRTDLIPADAFILVGVQDDSFAELYAPVVDFDSDFGVGTGKAGEVFSAKSWATNDPSGRWLKLESRPLPVILRPDAVVSATVV